GRYHVYKEVSDQIREIFHEYTELVEPVSIDEAYLDVTINKKGVASATCIAREIKQKIHGKTGLTASAGVSYNKFLAKIASDMDKPDGLVVIPPERAREVLLNLPIGKFHGIGEKCEHRMKSLGINNGADLKRRTLKELTRHFGKMGSFYYYIVRGIDNREVMVNRVRKSIGMERTFAADIDDRLEMLTYLKEFTAKLCADMKEKGVKGRTLTLKIKYANFDMVTRSITLPQSINDEKISFYYVGKLLQETIVNSCLIRLLGVSFANLDWDRSSLTRQIEFNFFQNYPSLLEK
ncbi:MAG: DNA polymerase IV, partial [Candidatus Cloacimonetes bacterium]|nr:DNA polymerase IV [Candidatus Cloacimonadota bacterium]